MTHHAVVVFLDSADQIQPATSGHCKALYISSSTITTTRPELVLGLFLNRYEFGLLI